MQTRGQTMGVTQMIDTQSTPNLRDPDLPKPHHTTPDNEYTWYKNVLAGKKPPIHDGDVQSGRFRMKQKDGPSVGMAIWRDWANAGVLMASYDSKVYVC